MGTELELNGERVILLPQKALYWPREECLLLSDIHLGKISHFRKSGIALPMEASRNNFVLLQDLFLEVTPKRVIFLGDLFHSSKNIEWELFCEFIKTFSNIQFDLVIGNHDLFEREEYEGAGLNVYEEGLDVGPFFLTHHPIDEGPRYNICGHIHPGIRIRGRARQSIRLACFYLQPARLVLPAFGTFTGLHIVQPKEGDRVYAIANTEIMKIDQ